MISNDWTCSPRSATQGAKITARRRVRWNPSPIKHIREATTQNNHSSIKRAQTASRPSKVEVTSSKQPHRF
jgi:hypothetical protein